MSVEGFHINLCPHCVLIGDWITLNASSQRKPMKKKYSLITKAQNGGWVKYLRWTNTLAFWKNLHFKSSAAVGLEIKMSTVVNVNRLPFLYCVSSAQLKLSGWGSGAHLLAGSFWRHVVISFLNDLPYFLSTSLSSTPVSSVGGSFCRVSIKTCRDTKGGQECPHNMWVDDGGKKNQSWNLWIEMWKTHFRWNAVSEKFFSECSCRPTKGQLPLWFLLSL